MNNGSFRAQGSSTYGSRPISSNNVQSARQRSGNLASIVTSGGETVLQVHDTYPRSLILTDIMLTRMGFAILSRNSAGNVIRAQYNGNDVESGEKRSGISSWFNRTKSFVGLGSKDNKALVRGRIYQISITNQQGANLVRFAGSAGASLSSVAQKKIITMLNSEFNR
jgi:hypothetical protein